MSFMFSKYHSPSRSCNVAMLSASENVFNSDLVCSVAGDNWVTTLFRPLFFDFESDFFGVLLACFTSCEVFPNNEFTVEQDVVDTMQTEQRYNRILCTFIVGICMVINKMNRYHRAID